MAIVTITRSKEEEATLAAEEEATMEAAEQATLPAEAEARTALVAGDQEDLGRITLAIAILIASITTIAAKAIVGTTIATKTKIRDIPMRGAAEEEAVAILVQGSTKIVAVSTSVTTSTSRMHLTNISLNFKIKTRIATNSRLPT